jgi:LacI family transcriptional regulator
MGIKQIAKLANVSIGTVDRVLHKRAGVSKETEKKVLKVIEETGYIKNTTASRLKLASVKKIKIAVLIPESRNKWNYWKLPRKGISKAVEELKELGVKADYFDFWDSTSYRALSKQIFLKRYDAILTVAFFVKESNVLLEKAKNQNIPVVFLDTEIELDGPAYFIRQNSHNAGMVAGRLLHDLVGNKGEYFVVNILTKGMHANSQQRENGFRAFFDSIKEQVRIHTISYSLNDEFQVTSEMETWFKKDGLKGIFVTNSKSHLLPKILKEYNIGRTCIVGFDLNKRNVKYLRNGDIQFLINQQPKFQGYSAIKGLFYFLTKRDTTALSMDIPVEIIVKENSDSL